MLKYKPSSVLTTSRIEPSENDNDIVSARKDISVSTQDFLAVMELHKRLNHASKASMISGLKNHTWSNIDLSPQLVDRVMTRYSCLGCLLGKSNRSPRAIGSQIPSTHPGQVISIDRVGPIKPAALGDFCYIYLFVDDYSDFWCAILAKPPANSAQFIAAIQTVRLYYLKYGHKVLKLRFDAGIIENSDLVNQYLATQSIVSDSAAPGAQYQDPAERHIQTLIKFVTTCLIDQKYLDNLFWGLATLSVTHTHNALPSPKLPDGQSPSFAATSIHPDLSKKFQFYFGQPVASIRLHQPKKGSSFKFAPRRELGYAIGSTDGLNGATLIYIPGKGAKNHVFPRVDVHAVKLPSHDHLSLNRIQAVNFTPPIIQPDGSTEISLPHSPEFYQQTHLEAADEFSDNHTDIESITSTIPDSNATEIDFPTADNYPVPSLSTPEPDRTELFESHRPDRQTFLGHMRISTSQN